MRYQAILLTGTSGSGKSTIAQRLCKVDSRFEHIKAITTREPRQTDVTGTYEYLLKGEFQQLVDGGKLLTQGEYRGYQYGIRNQDYQSAVAKSRVPLLTVTPKSAKMLADAQLAPGSDRPVRTQIFFTAFVDEEDNVLDQRLQARSGSMSPKEVSEQRKVDRSYSDSFLYKISNRNLDSTVELLTSLWDYSNVSGVLNGRLIRLMVECGMLLEKAELNNISGASYDLSLGDEYFYGGRIRKLSDSDPILLIEPYDYAIVTSDEVANFPRDICGRFDLSVSLFCQGIILSNGPQVDPGFSGPLFCLLLNTSSKPVLLKRRHHYATLEFHKLIEPTYTYRGGYQAKNLLHYLPTNVAQGAINELKKDLEDLRKESRMLRDITWAILSLIFAVIAIWVALR
jgi:guanylate kinase/deoxycytidine triphosphate deaminase